MGIEATGSPGSLQSLVSQSTGGQERAEQQNEAQNQAQQTQEQDRQARQAERAETAAAQETARLETQNRTPEATDNTQQSAQSGGAGQRVGSIVNTQV